MVQTPAITSPKIIKYLRLTRSTIIPATGVTKIRGSWEKKPTNVKAVAELVNCQIQMVKAKTVI